MTGKAKGDGLETPSTMRRPNRKKGKPLTKDKYLAQRKNLGKQRKILGKTRTNPPKRLKNKELRDGFFGKTTFLA